MMTRRDSSPVTSRSRRLHWPALLLAALLAAGTIPVPPLPPIPDSHAALIEQLLAVVNGKTIALSDLRRYRLLFAPNTPPDQVLQRMIDHQLLLAEAVRFDIEQPDPARVNEAVQRLERTAGGRTSWESALRQAQLTPTEAEQLITEELRVETLLAERVDQFVIVTKTEVESVYDQQAERFQGKTLGEVDAEIERELVLQKMTAKRQEYMSRLRSRATITLLTDMPGTLPAKP